LIALILFPRFDLFPWIGALPLELCAGHQRDHAKSARKPLLARPSPMNVILVV